MEDQEEIIEQLEKLDLTLSNIRRTFKQIENKIDCYEIKNKEVVTNLQPWIRFFSLNEATQEAKNNNVNIENNAKIDTNYDKKEQTSVDDPLNYQQANEHENSDSSSLLTLDFDALPQTFKNEKILMKIFDCIKKSKKILINDLFSICKEEDKLKIFLNVLINKKMIKIENEYIVCKEVSDI
ncbi:hypothetical protein BDAP_000494 [Binucleata daphniae]